MICYYNTIFFYKIRKVVRNIFINIIGYKRKKSSDGDEYELVGTIQSWDGDEYELIGTIQGG